MAPSDITSITARELSLELTEPFGIAGGSAERARFVVVELRLADGTLGLGEAAPLPAYNAETVDDALRAVDAARGVWLGQSGSAWRQRASELREVASGSASARCGLEMALCDALARRSGVSLYDWFGGAGPARLESDVTIPIVEAEAAESAARAWWARGFRTLKIKVGRAHDAERVLAVHRGAPGARLLLDANGAFDAAGALALLDEVERAGARIDLFEQPTSGSDWGGLERVARRVRVAVDESVATASDAWQASRRLGAPHVINVKLMKSGIAEALDIAAVARASGMSLMIGGMLESSLAMSASACFAAGQGGFEYVDLDTHLFLRDSPCTGGFAIRGAELDVSVIRIGHGVGTAT